MPTPPATRLAALARERAAFLDALVGMTEEERAFHPEPGAWSPLEIAEHVLRVERSMVQGLEKQLAAGDGRTDVGRRSGASVTALLFALRAPKRISVPEAARGIRPEGMDFDALRGEWAAVGARWGAAVEAFPAALEGVPLLRHPLAGALTLSDALRFLAVHAARHRRQLERTLDAATASARSR